MTAAIYARFSSDLQDARSIEDQVARLRERMQRDNVAFAEKLVFSDAATSGSTWERPGLQALLKAVTSGEVTAIYVESIDRLSRDLGDAARIRKRLEFHRCRLHSIGDGIDLDGRGSSSIAYDIKTMVAEIYLKDLGDKTLRGLQGRARDGKSTGGRTYGYATTAEKAIVIAAAEADVVRRIFTLHAKGSSCAAIAKELNDARIEPPRPRRRRVGDGWIASCIREMLRNPRYAGDWSFGRRQWRKDPDTRRRLPQLREQDEILVLPRPELAIVPKDVWEAVQMRHAATHEKHSKPSATPKRPTKYLLSTLLVCGCCGGLMEISGGGGGQAYYRCAANRKRGTCDNRLSVRESLAREKVVNGIRALLTTRGNIDHVRQRLAEKLGELGRTARKDIEERSSRLSRTEQRVRGLILMQAEGDRSQGVADLRRDLEAQAVQERAEIDGLRGVLRAPTRLPSPDEIVERYLDLERYFELEPVTGRETLRRLIKGGTIRLVPEDGVYVARCEVLPLAVLMTEKEKPPQEGPETVLSSYGCGGRI
jgi:site-specific DNA recombinase